MHFEGKIKKLGSMLSCDKKISPDPSKEEVVIHLTKSANIVINYNLNYKLVSYKLSVYMQFSLDET